MTEIDNVKRTLSNIQAETIANIHKGSGHDVDRTSLEDAKHDLRAWRDYGHVTTFYEKGPGLMIEWDDDVDNKILDAFDRGFLNAYPTMSKNPDGTPLISEDDDDDE